MENSKKNKFSILEKLVVIIAGLLIVGTVAGAIWFNKNEYKYLDQERERGNSNEPTLQKLHDDLQQKEFDRTPTGRKIKEAKTLLIIIFATANIWLIIGTTINILRYLELKRQNKEKE